MSTEVVMPRMGETVDEGTVNVWHKAQGDQVTEEPWESAARVASHTGP